MLPCVYARVGMASLERARDERRAGRLAAEMQPTGLGHDFRSRRVMWRTIVDEDRRAWGKFLDDAPQRLGFGPLIGEHANVDDRAVHSGRNA